MNSSFFIIFLLAVESVFANFGIGYTGDELILSANQNKTITLDCADLRSGTIRLTPELTDCTDSHFHVNFLVKYGPRCRGYFRFYVNIRKLHLDHNEEIRLYDSAYSRRYSRTFVGQHLPDFTPESLSESVSQFFTSRDSLRMEYSRLGSCDASPTDLVLDFSLIQTDKKRTADEFFCPALRGFVPRLLFCANESHITCPDSFRWSNAIRNPAFNRDMIDRCKDQWLPKDLPEFIDQWIPHGIPREIVIPSQGHEQPSWNPLSWSPSNWIPSNLPWLRPASQSTFNIPNFPFNQHNQGNIDLSELQKRIVGFGGPYDSETDLPDPIVFEDFFDTTDKPDTTDRPDSTDASDGTDRTDSTDLTEWTDKPDGTDAPDSTDAPEVEDDGPLQKPWRSPPLRLSQVKHHAPSGNHSHNHTRLGTAQIMLIIVAGILGLIVLPVAICCWFCRRGQRIEYHRIQTDSSASALPGGYGTFDGNVHGNSNGKATFNGPQYVLQTGAPVNMSAPSYPYPAHQVKYRPPD